MSYSLVGYEGYTADIVRMGIANSYESYYAKLATGQSPTWKCDQRTKDLFCLSNWLMDELMARKCPDEDRRFIQNFFNRKARSANDLYELAAAAMNSYLNDTIERYRGK